MTLSQLAGLTALAVAMCGNRGFAGTITPGVPAFPGVDTFTFTDQLTGLRVVIPVVITPAIVASVTPAAAKESAIVAAALAAGIPAKDIFTDGGDVKLLGYSKVGSVIGSGELSTIAYGGSFSDPNGPALATLGYGFEPGSTALSGLNAHGGVASYTVGFTFTDSVAGTVSLNSTMTFAQLNSPTIDGLLTNEFNSLQAQLLTQAPSLAGMLKLDLADATMVLNFPSTVLAGSVTTNVTDTSLIENQSIAAAPEPASVAMLAAALMVFWWRRRQSNAAAEHLP